MEFNNNQGDRNNLNKGTIIEPYYYETIKEKPKKQKKGRKYLGITLSVVLVLVIGISSGVTIGYLASPEITQMLGGKAVNSDFALGYGSPITNNNAAENVSNSNGNVNNPVVSIAKEVGPSVVTVTSIIKVKDWFNNVYDQEGTGSGVIFGEKDNEIYIVTNYHVVDRASEVKITLYGNQTIPATIKGYDKQADLAVVTINKEDIPLDIRSQIKIANLGDSDMLQVGEIAVAIGNPLGKQTSNTVTVGYISGLNREIAVSDKPLKLIQTDAAINPGNSGGALVNSRGEVIGINAIKLVDEKVEGMGFAIPINTVKPIIEDIVNQKPKPFLGIIGIDLGAEKADLVELPIGIYIKQVVPQSAAAEGGIQQGDIIFEFDGEKISSMQKLSEIISTHEVGDKINIKLIRNQNKKMETNIELKDYKEFNQ